MPNPKTYNTGGLSLVTFHGGNDRKGSRLSLHSKTRKIIIALSKCNDTNNSETLEKLGCLNFAFENLLEMDLVI